MKIKGIFFLSVKSNILGILLLELIKSSKLLLFNSIHLFSTNLPKKEIISFIHFYSPDDGKSPQLKDVFIELDKEYSGMFKLAGLNCKLYHDLCHKQGVDEYPSFMIYPPLPAPVMKYEGKIDVKHIFSYLGKFVDNKCVELNNNNFDDFINSKLNIPKILLFTDKKNIPLIFKRLSLAFNVRIKIYNFNIFFSFNKKWKKII